MNPYRPHYEPPAAGTTAPPADNSDQLAGQIQNSGFVTAHTRALADLLEARRFLRATLDALLSRIAILNERGTIIEANAAWNEFNRKNRFSGGQGNVGENYLTLCEAAGSSATAEAQALTAGIRAVIAGERPEFEKEYPGPGSNDQCWFVVRVTRFAGDATIRVVVAHDNITERKQAEIALARTQQQLVEASQRTNEAEVTSRGPDSVDHLIHTVSVAASVLADRLKQFKATNLSVITGLLPEYETDLTENEKGRQIAAYLTQFGEHLANEHTGVLQEVAGLQKNLDYIKDLLTRQS